MNSDTARFRGRFATLNRDTFSRGLAVIEVKAFSFWSTVNAIPNGVAWLKGFIP